MARSRRLALLATCVLVLHHGTAAEMSVEDEAGELSQIFAMMDANEDGKVSAAEFAKMSRAGAAQDADAFKLMDSDGDGFASRAEVTLFAKRMGNIHTEDDPAAVAAEAAARGKKSRRATVAAAAAAAAMASTAAPAPTFFMRERGEL